MTKKFKKWEPWMGEAAKEHYQRGKPEEFNATLRYDRKVAKNMIVSTNNNFYKILEIKEVINERLFVRVIGRWQQLSLAEEVNMILEDDKVNYIF